MNPILETLMFIAVCLVPVSIMGMNAFLAYKQVKGWGWFLLASLLVLGSMKIKFGGF